MTGRAGNTAGVGDPVPSLRSVCLPGLSCTSLGKHVHGKGGKRRKLAAGSLWDRTLGNLLCDSTSTSGGLSLGCSKPPLLQGASPCLRGSGVMPQQAEPGIWLRERRGGGLGPWPPASPCVGEVVEGRKCRVLTPHFHHGDGRRSPVPHRASCCSPGCSQPAGLPVLTLAVTTLQPGPSCAQPCSGTN